MGDLPLDICRQPLAAGVVILQIAMEVHHHLIMLDAVVMEE